MDSQLVLMAPIESVALGDGTFQSMGQTVFVAAEFFDEFSAGDYVAVYGTVAGPGFLYADSVVPVSDEYVSGSSEILVAGYPSTVYPSRALAILGSLDIDYGSSMTISQHPSADDVFTFSGVEAQPGSGLLTSSSVQRGATN